MKICVKNGVGNKYILFILVISSFGGEALLENLIKKSLEVTITGVTYVA